LLEAMEEGFESRHRLRCGRKGNSLFHNWRSYRGLRKGGSLAEPIAPKELIIFSISPFRFAILPISLIYQQSVLTRVRKFENMA
jgi:hypothetical protein